MVRVEITLSPLCLKCIQSQGWLLPIGVVVVDVFPVNYIIIAVVGMIPPGQLILAARTAGQLVGRLFASWLGQLVGLLFGRPVSLPLRQAVGRPVN